MKIHVFQKFTHKRMTDIYILHQLSYGHTQTLKVTS